MLTERETVRFLTASQEIWLRHFPALHRRAQWHLTSHLAVRARTGAALGELYGLVKQVFLLDDATVRERVGELRALGLCALDPADAPLTARTVVVPSTALFTQYDLYLRDIGVRLLTLGAALAGLRATTAVAIDAPNRTALLEAVEAAQETWIAGAEQLFEATSLSRARRIDARRHLLSISHSTLLLMALEQKFAAARPPGPEEEDGLLADQMAAALLGAIKQNFQTTRDHLAYLMRIRLIERRPGRALRVALAGAAEAPFAAALRRSATALAGRAEALSRRAGSEDGTGLAHIVLPDIGERAAALVITGPGDPPPRIELGEEPLVLGRAPGAGLMLPSAQVSRAHCRLEVADGAVLVTDLNSTNGTFIDNTRISGTARLEPGSVLRVGPYRLTIPDSTPEGTLRAHATLRGLGKPG
ncbi:MAG: FHA domain-containing protein [Acetobacteraceae bacterium]